MWLLKGKAGFATIQSFPWRETVSRNSQKPQWERGIKNSSGFCVGLFCPPFLKEEDFQSPKRAFYGCQAGFNGSRDIPSGRLQKGHKELHFRPETTGELNIRDCMFKDTYILPGNRPTLRGNLKNGGSPPSNRGDELFYLF